MEKSVDVAKIYPGPILILSGPGTGKTHQLARRVKWLVEDKGVKPDEITIITFTGEAARNMKERLCDDTNPEIFVQVDKQPKHIRTMHSLGQLIINEEYKKVGLRKDFTLITGEIRKILLEDAARILGFNGSDTTEECRRKGYCKKSDDEKCKICKEYCTLLRGLNAIDYDDQIFLACKLLNNLPNLLSKWKSYTKHLLIDEYQDINQAQYNLIRLLSQGQEHGIFVVGDDDQSIYSWRGGNPNFIRKFKTHFGNGAQIYSLDECWRCPPQILKSALTVVKKDNLLRLNKEKLHSSKKGTFNKPKVWEVPSEKYEARKICELINKVAANQDVLVLVPAHRFAIPIKRAMRKMRIGYDCKTNVADTGLNAINDLISWLKNEEDNFALRICIERIILNPLLKIPFEKLNSIKEKRNKTLSKISKLWTKVINEKMDLYTCLQTELCNQKDIETILGFVRELKNKWEEGNGNNFMEAVTRIIRPWTSNEKISDEIEEWVEDSLARNASNTSTLARILTMESAKGLGMDSVFIVGLNKGILPQESLGQDELLEKQRLMYVSMTRAKKELHLFYARTREGKFSFQPISIKNGKRNLLEPSVFIEWLKDTVEFEEKWS